MLDQDQREILDKLLASNEESGTKRVVVMMCGLAGSGKTTMAKEILAHYPNFERLSIDELIAERHGLFQVDYPADKYEEYQDEADKELHKRMIKQLENRSSNLVVDRSFWSRATRDEFRSFIEAYHARCILIYLQPPNKEFIRQRIDSRRIQGRNANSALDINDDLLDRFWNGFEVPDGEGEVVIRLK